MQIPTFYITKISKWFHRTGKRFIIDHGRYLVNETWRKRGYLQSIVLECFVFNIDCFFGLTYYLKWNSLSATKTMKEESFLQDSVADGHKHRNWRLYVQWGTPDDERLTLETCRVVYI
jgi:hypothetical protein